MALFIANLVMSSIGINILFHLSGLTVPRKAIVRFSVLWKMAIFDSIVRDCKPRQLQLSFCFKLVKLGRMRHIYYLNMLRRHAETRLVHSRNGAIIRMIPLVTSLWVWRPNDEEGTTIWSVTCGRMIWYVTRLWGDIIRGCWNWNHINSTRYE